VTTKASGERVRLAVYLVSFLLHGGLWQGVRSLEPPPPPPPPPIKITMRDVPAEPPPPEPPPPEPEPAAEPEAPPADVAPTPTPPKPEPTPAKPKKQKPATPEPAAEPPAAAPDFGVQMQGGTGPGGTSVPSGDPGGSSATPAPRERVEAKARKLDSKPKKTTDDSCSEDEVRPAPLEIPQPPYSDAARSAGVEGKVRVQLSISADGSVTAVKVVTPLHPDLDDAARVAMKSAKFTPATRCGKPVATTLTISVKFTL